MVRPVPAGRKGSCCTPYSRLQEEIDNVETIAVTANNTANNASQLAQQAMTRDTFDDVNVNGDLNVYGDIIQQGAAYETHAQHVFSTDDYIVMRDGALVGLAVGDYSGFQVKKYDGTNDGRLVIDKDGVARVGDVGDEQPLLTRDESADMVDAAPLVWDAANSKAISGAFPVSDPGVASINGITPDASNNFGIEAGSNITITSGTNKITIAAAGGGGGAWTFHTSNNWSDLFRVEATGHLTTLKDIIFEIVADGSRYYGITYLPKGVTSHTNDGFILNIGGSKTDGTDSYIVPIRARIEQNRITSSYISIWAATRKIDFVNQTVTDTVISNAAIYKSNIYVYYRD